MQALRLNWPICRQGYEILEFRRSVVEWGRFDHEVSFDRGVSEGSVIEFSGSVPPPADATAAERRLLAKWGILLMPDPGVPKELGAIEHVIEPRSERMHIVNVLAAAPDLFV